jgi:hypothetical protein
MKIIKGYKFITDEMKSKNGNFKWELGIWQEERSKDIKLCEYGLHACKTPYQSLKYIYGNRWFQVEARGKIIYDNKNSEPKFVASEMRLVKELPTKKIVVEFACWCARQCLKNYQKEFPNDKRPEEAIKAAEDYMDGKIDLKELNDKKSAAWSARSAAESAESAAESAESAAESAESAAWSARSAAWSAQKKQLNKIVRKYL